MLREKDCAKILNSGEKKYTIDEILLIREFLSTLATIELEIHQQNKLSSTPGTK